MPLRCLSAPARVVGCLIKDSINVIVCPGQGLADGGIHYEIKAELIPEDLRIPNSEFDILMVRDTGEIVKILRKGESPDPAGFIIDNGGNP